jgi:hypothetical protein
LGAADLWIAQKIYSRLSFARLLGIIQENCCYGIAATGLRVFRVAEHRGQRAKREGRGLRLENAGLPDQGSDARAAIATPAHDADCRQQVRRDVRTRCNEAGSSLQRKLMLIWL